MQLFMMAGMTWNSKSQYEKKFTEWGFRTYLSRREWIYIGQCLKKRKAEGKESDIYFNGKRIDAKKVKRETSRYQPTTIERFSARGRELIKAIHMNP